MLERASPSSTLYQLLIRNSFPKLRTLVEAIATSFPKRRVVVTRIAASFTKLTPVRTG
jgi:hypothetical protein